MRLPTGLFAHPGPVFRRTAFFAVIVVLQLAGGARADWSDNFDGGPHNPPNGAWGYLGLSLAAVPATIPNWSPVYTSDLVYVPPPGSPGGQPMYLAAGYVGGTGTNHRYGDVRVAGTVGVGGQNNNNLVGLIARAADFDSYVLAVDHSNGSARLVKSLDATPNNPFTMTSQPIFGYSPGLELYLQLDVQDITGGTRLVGKIYEDVSRTNLLNTLIAFDDAGSTVPGAPHAPYYSGWVAQYNTAAASPSFIDAYFDNMSSTTLRPGDVNLDGTVNRRDAARMVQGFGKTANATWDDGDLDGNGRVDLADVGALQRRLSSGAIIVPPPVDIVADIAAVPEPAGVTLLLATGLCAAAASVAKRRRPRSDPRI